MSDWTYDPRVNDITGKVTQRWTKRTYTVAGHWVLYDIYELNGRYYWCANIMIKHRPDLSVMASGTYAVTPYSLSVAKTRATRRGKRALEAAKTRRHAVRTA